MNVGHAGVALKSVNVYMLKAARFWVPSFFPSNFKDNERFLQLVFVRQARLYIACIHTDINQLWRGIVVHLVTFKAHIVDASNLQS